MDLYVIPVTDSPDVEKFIVYRPRLGVAFASNRAMASLAQNLIKDTSTRSTISPDIERFLETVGFFQPDPPAPAPMGGPFKPGVAVLLMTNQCQLRCTYCYAAAGEFVRQDLTFELARAVIDYVHQNAVDQGLPHFEVSFHGGGEPTFAWSVLQESADYARNKALASRLTITSNGIWSPRQREWIISNFDGATISMDGAPRTQDRHRPFKSGRASSSYVMETIAALDEHQLEYGIRLTATFPWTDLPGDVQFICDNTKCQVMQVEPAFNTKRGGHTWPDETEACGFADAYLEASDIATQAGRRLLFSGARLGTVTPTFCTAPYNALIVNGGGHLVTCYEVASDAHTLGELSIIGRSTDEQIVVDETARNRLHGLMAERRSLCEGCFCYWSCAGDCYARAFSNGPDGHLYYSRRCDMNRSITRELLLRRIASSGGVWYAPREAFAPHV